jgi:hypothetical protein
LNLREYIQTHKCQGFVPSLRYSATGDQFWLYFTDAPSFAEELCEGVTVLRCMESKAVVGVKINAEKLRELMGGHA